MNGSMSGGNALALRLSAPWLIGLGGLFALLGAIGLFMTFALTIASALWYGLLLLAAGIAQTAEAALNRERGWGSLLGRTSLGILYIIGGLVMVLNPVGASLVLTLVLGAMLIASGAVRGFIALSTNASWRSGWRGATVFAAALSALLGIAILVQWPVSGLWAIGLFLACDLIAFGLSWLIAGFRAFGGHTRNMA